MGQVSTSSPSNVSVQRLAVMDKIENLRRTKHVIQKLLKPWADTALQLTQDAQSAIARLHWLLERVTAATDGPASLTLVNIAQQAVAQSQEVLPPLVCALDTLHAKIEAAPPQ